MTSSTARFVIAVTDATRAGFAAAEAGARRFAASVSGALANLGINGPGGAVAGVTALGLVLGKVVKDGIEFGDAIAKGASRAGIGVEAFSRLAFAADQADLEIQ